MNELLRSDLASADPVAAGEDARLHDLVRRMTVDTREASIAGTLTRAPWWKRRRTMIPLGIAGAIALTGAAVMIPLGIAVNGTPVEMDVEIPILYTTDTGVDVSCRYGIYFGDPATRSAADERLAEFAQNHDWTGIGQRVYEEAIANPFAPGPNDVWETDTQELRDRHSFNLAIGGVLYGEIPAELRAEGQQVGGTMDCTGQLR
ncbi:hypothetical protein LTA6_002867 [Microbacterium sp. LTA6]|uniref:hypothetical protein n=1 Tax=unclassified Microbacterium TaxID=2609290 RepID=UPI0031388F5E